MIFVDTDYVIDNDGYKYSTTVMRHMGKYCEGVAIAAPDEPHPSELFGGRLSEARAMLDGFQYEKNIRKREYKAIENLVKACLCTKDFDKESPSAKVLFHQLNIAKKKYEQAKEKVELTKKGIKTMMDDRDKYFEKRAKKDNK